jgi:type IV pilus assembly protein PilA
MITIAIIGLLSAVAIPQFLNARERADAKAKVGELVGIAKECAVFNAEADENQTTVHPPTGGEIPCGGSTPSKQNMQSRPWSASLTIECLGTTIEDATKVEIQVTESGKMSCGKPA